MKKYMNKIILTMIASGIDIPYMELMKERIFEEETYSGYYDFVKTSILPEAIDTSKIRGTCTPWDTSNKSVYDLFFSDVLTIKESMKYDGTITDDLEKNILLQSDSISTEPSTLPNFYYFEDDDIYFTDQVIQTVHALMFHVPQLIGTVHTFKKDSMRYTHFLLHTEAKNTWEYINKIPFKMLILDEIITDDKISYKVTLQKYPNIDLFEFDSPLISTIDLQRLKFKHKMIFVREKNTVDALIKKCLDIDELLTSRTSRLRKNSLVSKIFKYNNSFSKTEDDIVIDMDDTAENIVRGIHEKLHIIGHKEEHSAKK